MRVCTQCGHKLTAEEYLCPSCELWDSRSYVEPRHRKKVKGLGTIFVGRLQDAMAVRQLCEKCGIPAFVEASERVRRMGGEAGTVKVQVPADRMQEVGEMLARHVAGEEESDPALRKQRFRLRARLSLRRRAYRALGWSILALVFPPAGLVAVKLASGVLAENHGLPVVSEESRVATAAMVVSATAMLVFGVVAWFLIRAK